MRKFKLSLSLVSLLSHFLSNPQKVEKMREKAAIALPGHSTERVVDKMLKLTMKSTKKQKVG